MKSDFTIVTRSKNIFLTKRAQEFFDPIAKEKIIIEYPLKGNNNYVQFIGESFFMMELFRLNGWIIHIDEDAYCWNINEVVKIKEYMEEKNIQIGGASDMNVNPISINPFFMIINMDKINNIGVEELPDNYYMTEKVKYDAHYLFFLWMKNNGINFLYLEGEEVNIKSKTNPTILHGIENPFLIHSWDARFYNKNSKIKKKIDYCYDYARKKIYIN